MAACAALPPQRTSNLIPAPGFVQTLQHSALQPNPQELSLTRSPAPLPEDLGILGNRLLPPRTETAWLAFLSCQWR